MTGDDDLTIRVGEGLYVIELAGALELLWGDVRMKPVCRFPVVFLNIAQHKLAHLSIAERL